MARFFDQSLDLLCIAGFDGHFKRLNPAWTVRLGWTLDELLERPFLDFVHPDDREATEVELANLAEGTDTIFFENRYRHRDGTYRWLQWHARPAPVCKRIYAAGRDVTRRKRQEREIVEIADREKARLGRELHDGLCQGLAGIAALSATLSRRLARRSDASASTAAEITELLNEAMHEARDLARGLDPAGLRSGGLTAALERAADKTERLFRVACTFTCGCPLPRLRREDEEHLFRIAQEAVRNAVAHARCGRIEIELSHDDGRGLLSVRDDGVGLPNGASLAGGIGLHTMAYRARLIGASLEVRRRAGGGTVASCSFPLSEPAVPPRRRSPGIGSSVMVAKATEAGPPAAKRILLVDDHPLFRRGLASLIDAEPDLAVCGEAGSAAEALEAIAERHPDLVIVDLVLEGRDGLDLLKELRSRRPKLPALVLSMHDELLYAERALKAGARGYLDKQQLDDTALVAIRRVLAGEIWLSERLEQRLACRFLDGRTLETGSPLAALSDRELEVFRWIGLGRSTRQIAETLELSVKTIESHREHIKNKLGLESAPELSRRAALWVQTGRSEG